MNQINDPVLQFDFENAEKIDIYRRQLETLYATVEGSCPGDRNFGLSNEYLDEPPDVAEVSLSLEIYNKTEEYVPQVEIIGIEFEYDLDGGMRPKITVGLNEEYDEEEESEDDDE